MSQIYCILAILFTFAAFGVDSDPLVDCLFPTKDMNEKLEKFWKACGKELKIDIEKDLPKSPEDLASKGFDDKCFSKCVYEKFGLVEKGEISKDKYMEMLKKDPDAKGAGLGDIEFIAGPASAKCYSKQDAKDDLCKKATKFGYCYRKELGPQMCTA